VAHAHSSVNRRVIYINTTCSQFTSVRNALTKRKNSSMLTTRWGTQPAT
jgi:hypothetical protein